MLQIKIDKLENGIENVKLSYEIMKSTGKKCGLFGKDEICYFENNILELTDDLSEISNILYEELNLQKFRVSCKTIDFSIDYRDALDIIENIKKRGKKCNVIKISSTRNDNILYFYNCLFTEMLDEYLSRFFKYRFSFDYFEFKNK